MTNNDDKNKIREKEGVITAAAGLALNLILGGAKLAFGIITGSLSIMSDAVNNLSDVGTSAVAVSSFVISGKKADREHPYGHGRFEYVAAFVVSALVLIVGAELLISSVKSLFSGRQGRVFSACADRADRFGCGQIRYGNDVFYTQQEGKVGYA